MRTLSSVLVLFGLVLQTHTAIPPCVGLMRYSREAMNLVFQAQRFLLQDALSNSETSATISGLKVNAGKIKIHSADIHDISVRLVPSFGVKVSIVTELKMSFIRDHKVSDLQVLADVTSMLQIVQDASGNPKLGIEKCDTEVKHLGDLQGAENLELLRKDIIIALNHQLCLITTSILLGVNVQLGEFTGLINLGIQVQLRYFLSSSPAVTNQHLEFGVNVDYYLLGRRLDISVHSECLPLPAETSKVTPMYSLLLPQDTFNAVFSAMEWAGAFNLEITGESSEKNNILTTATLQTVSPDILLMYPEARPVIMKVGASRAPRVTLHKEMIVLYLQPSLELMVMPPQDIPAQSLMTLSMDIEMKIRIKIDDHSLKTDSVSLIRNVTLSLESAAVGSVKVDTLQQIISPLLEKALVLHYKGALSVGWTLPNILHLKLMDPHFDVYEGYAVISGNLHLPE